MNKCFPYVFWCLFLLYFNASAKQDSVYYYHNMEKVYLERCYDKIHIHINSCTDRLYESFRNNELKLQTGFLGDNADVVLCKSDNSYISDSIVDYYKNFPEISSVNYVLQKQGYLFFTTDVIVVKLKKETSKSVFEDIIRCYNGVVIDSGSVFDRQFSVLVNDTALNVFDIANVLCESGLFEYSEPDFSILDAFNTNDSYYSTQWNFHNTGFYGGNAGVDINAEKAWKLSQGDTNIRVSVIDTGVDFWHPDLINNVVLGYDVTGNNSQGAPIWITDNHGTACAGIIGAVTNNTIGVAGVSHNCKVVPVHMTHPGPILNSSLAAKSIKWAWENGADVISNSWVFAIPLAQLDSAIFTAASQGRNGKGCVLVFAAGNNNDTVNYPACLGNVIAVGAIDRCGVRSGRIDVVPESCEPWNSTADPGSAFGEKLDVVAPGTHIYTTDRQGNEGYNELKGTAGDYYEFFGGTSAACPHVAGVAALMLSINPNLTSQEVRDIVEQTARKIRKDLYSYVDTLGHPNGEWNMYMGYGLIDAHRAVLKAAYHKIYGDSLLTLCDTNVHPYTVHSTHNADIDSVSFFWTCSDNLQIVVGQNTDSVWVRPSNGGTGHLCCYIIHDSDTVISTLDIPIVSNYTVYDNIFVNNGIGFPDTFILSRNIEIDSMTVLTWQDKSILCTPDSRIVVHPGGKLVVDGGTLTNSCTGEMWQGIFVEGHSNLHQTSANQGTVVLKNGAVIENALCGIRTGAPGDTSNTTTGGIVHASDATFRNCAKSVAFFPYADTVSGTTIRNNFSGFSNCTFTIDDNNLFAANGISFDVHAYLWDVRGVSFEGCTFSNAATAMTYDRGYAIRAEDAGFSVSTLCDTVHTEPSTACQCPADKATYSQFSGFLTAISANTTGNTYYVSVDEAGFSNNGTGVSFSGNGHVAVTRNDFNMNSLPRPVAGRLHGLSGGGEQLPPPRPVGHPPLCRDQRGELRYCGQFPVPQQLLASQQGRAGDGHQRRIPQRRWPRMHLQHVQRRPVRHLCLRQFRHGATAGKRIRGCGQQLHGHDRKQFLQRRIPDNGLLPQHWRQPYALHPDLQRQCPEKPCRQPLPEHAVRRRLAFASSSRPHQVARRRLPVAEGPV